MRGRFGRGPTGAPPLFRGRLLLAPRGGGRGSGGGRGLLVARGAAPPRRSAPPFAVGWVDFSAAPGLLAWDAGPCRAPGNGVRSDPGWAVWEELARGGACSLGLLPGMKPRSEGGLGPEAPSSLRARPRTWGSCARAVAFLVLRQIPSVVRAQGPYLWPGCPLASPSLGVPSFS